MGIERRLNRDVEITLTDPNAGQYESTEPAADIFPDVTYSGATLSADMRVKVSTTKAYYLKSLYGFVNIKDRNISLSADRAFAFLSRRDVFKAINEIKNSKELRSTFGEWLILFCFTLEDFGLVGRVLDVPRPIKIIRLNKQKTRKSAK